MQAGAVKEERIDPLSRGLRVGAGKGAATWSQATGIPEPCRRRTESFLRGGNINKTWKPL